MKAHWRSFILFASVGLGTAGVYFGVMAILLDVMHIGYRISVSIGYVAGVLFNFMMNKTLTFKQKQLSGTYGQIARYAVLVGINYVLTLMIVIFTVETLGFIPYVGVAFSMGATVITGYVLSHFWVFKRVS